MKYQDSFNLRPLKRLFVLICLIPFVLAVVLCVNTKENKSIPVQDSVSIPRNESTVFESESMLDSYLQSNSESDSSSSEVANQDTIREEKVSIVDPISCFPEADKWKNNIYYDFVHAVFFIYDYDGYYLVDNNSKNKYYLDPDCTEEIDRDDVKIVSSNFIPGFDSKRNIVHCYLLKNGCIAYIPQNKELELAPVLDTSNTYSELGSSEATNSKKDRYYDFVQCVYSFYDDGLYLTDPNSNTFYSDRNCTEEISNDDLEKISSAYIPGFDSKMNLVHCYLLGNGRIAFINRNNKDLS